MQGISAATPFLFCLWMIVVPMAAGLLLAPLLPVTRRTVGLTWLFGILISFLIFEPIAIICMLEIVFASFVYCTRIYAAVMAVLAAACVAVNIVRWKKSGKKGLKGLAMTMFPGYTYGTISDVMHPRRNETRLDLRLSKSERLYFAVFMVLLAVQLVMAVLYAPFDGDDAYYVVESVLAQQTDTMYTILPYTGYSTALDFRHAFATYPLWLAFMARMSMVHATIFAHTLLPLVWIPATYYVFHMIGSGLFGSRRDLKWLFMSLIAMAMLFGNVSIYTPETFFLMRTWQGKSMICNIVVPLIFFVFLCLAKTETGQEWRGIDRRDRAFPWILLFLVNIAAGFFSTSGILIISMLTAAAAFCTFVAAGWRGADGNRERPGKDLILHKVRSVLIAGASCMPNAVLVIMGLKMRPW